MLFDWSILPNRTQQVIWLFCPLVTQSIDDNFYFPLIEHGSSVGILFQISRTLTEIWITKHIIFVDLSGWVHCVVHVNGSAITYMEGGFIATAWSVDPTQARSWHKCLLARRVRYAEDKHGLRFFSLAVVFIAIVPHHVVCGSLVEPSFRQVV